MDINIEILLDKIFQYFHELLIIKKIIQYRFVN